MCSYGGAEEGESRADLDIVLDIYFGRGQGRRLTAKHGRASWGRYASRERMSGCWKLVVSRWVKWVDELMDGFFAVERWGLEESSRRVDARRRKLREMERSIGGRVLIVY